MTDDEDQIQLALRDRGLCSYVQNGRQIVVSRQRGPVWPDRGNSFWIVRLGGAWYVVTWAPVAYRVPEATSVVEVAAAFVDVGATAQSRLPAEQVERFGLTEVPQDEFERLFEAR